MCKCLWVLACANLFTTTAAYSAEWSLTSTLNPSAKYDDNVFMAENEQSSVQYSMTPTLMAKRAMKTSEVSLAAGYNVQRYTAFAQLDRQDPFVRFNSRLSTERNQYGLAASYSQSSSRSTAEQDTGDFTTESSVTSETISPSYSYQLTARDSISLGASYSTRTYSTTDFSDNKTKSVNSGWQHQLSERLSGGLNFSASNYQSDGLTLSSNDDNYNLSTTITYKLSELWQLNGSVGVRKLNSHRTDDFGASVNSSSSGSSFDFSVNRITELGSFSMGLSRSLSPSNNGDVNEQDRLTIAWSKALTEVLSTSLSASYQQSTSALVEGSDKRENINFSPSIKWQLERDLGLNLSYQYRQQKRSSANTNTNTNTNVSSNSLMMTLIYDWDGIRASR